SSGAVNHSGEDSGNENRRRSVRRKAHTASENVKSKNAKAGRGSVSKARGRKQKHVEAVTLFEVVTMGRGAMQVVIDDWIEAYVTDRHSPLLDLISFFIQCCGCKGLVTAEMCQNKEDSDVMSKMVEELDEVSGLQYKKFLAFPWILTVTWPMDTDSVEYPLTQAGPYGRWFHSEFCDFISVLVAQCQHSVIFDCYLMNAIISLLTELSDSFVRAFRHTCTLAAVKLLSSLASVALSLSVGIENSQKLFQVQKTKTLRQKSTLQQERIQKKITEEKRTEIESMMDIIFKGVFLKRHRRDVLPEIRSICLEELGLWMKLYSSSFLNDSYLKYMGWMLHDKVPDVRLKCVLGLQGLYGDPVLHPKLDLFTSRFKDRMISMTLDKDNEVAVQTMKLLLIISKTSDDVLSPEDYKQLLQFVYSSQRPLAVTAGELLYSRLLNTAAPASDTQDEINDDEAQKQDIFSTLKALLQFFKESQLHKHVVYLVDSLWDCGGALLKDWPALTSLLLQDPPSHRQGLTHEEKAVLVEILVASVRQAAEGPVLAGRSGAKKVMSAREKKIQIDDCTKLTEHLIVVLPTYCPSHTFSISSSFLLFFPQAVSDLLAEIGAVLDRHSGPAVLEAAARTYLSLCGEETSCCSAAHTGRDSLVQSWVDKLTALLQDALKVKLRSVHVSVFTAHSLTRSLRAANTRHRMQLRLFCERSHHCLSHSDPSVRQQAFLGVCDVLTAHSYQLQVWSPTSFGPLLYTTSPKLQRALLTFICQHAFVGSECDSRSSVEKLEDLHRRRNLLAAFCKLIIHGVLEMSMAAEVYTYYMKYYSDFGDIIKETMYRTRQMDKIESARTLVLCLQQLFVRLKREQESGGRAHPGVQTFTSIKELARRFALTFGDLVKFRECVVVIHRNGIEFVFQEFTQTPETPTPLYLYYLTILSEFSSKLLKPDKKTVFSYLQKHTAEHVIDLREEGWQPLIHYRASLLAAGEGEDAVSNVSSDRRPHIPNRSPFYKQKLEGTTQNKAKSNADPFSVPVEPPAKRLNMGGSDGGTSNEVESDTVEVEL
uniref:Cohesin subunit SA n=1 Tax=Labrus bergylta TaxID=56723 RepID=A0A3Q3N2W7_9LABR